MIQEKYDSEADTLAHIEVVRGHLRACQADLASRAVVHDRSKLQSPEKEVFDEYTPQTPRLHLWQ